MVQCDGDHGDWKDRQGVAKLLIELGANERCANTLGVVANRIDSCVGPAVASVPPVATITLPSHPHDLALFASRQNRLSFWVCDVCQMTAQSSSQGVRYRCQLGCDYDVCSVCAGL